MRWIAIVAALAATSTVLDNPRVRAYRITDGSRSGVAHGPAVVVSLDNAPDGSLGTATWVEDAAAASAIPSGRHAVAIVQPLRSSSIAPHPPAGSQPGDAPFERMSFKPVFENDRVSVIRARMEVGAREGFHTHGSDTVVVHLSGGEIEDTAAGKTIVNRWKPGDVEFESLGSSHSARNLGAAVDVVLVALKPR